MKPSATQLLHRLEFLESGSGFQVLVCYLQTTNLLFKVSTESKIYSHIWQIEFAVSRSVVHRSACQGWCVLKYHTWDIVPNPALAPIIGSEWVYSIIFKKEKEKVGLFY